MLDVRPTIGPNAGRTTGPAPPASAQRRAAGGRREAGKAEVSLRAVAARAGVSQATPHNLFGCKQAVLVGVLEDIRDFGKPSTSAAKLGRFDRQLHAAALVVGAHERDPDFYRMLWLNLLGSQGGEDRSAIFNPRRDAFWNDLLQAATDAGLLRRDLPVPVLRRMLDAAWRGTMLEWAVGELPRPALQASVALACLLVLRGAATLAGAALLAQRLQRGRPRPGPAGLRQADQ